MAVDWVAKRDEGRPKRSSPRACNSSRRGPRTRSRDARVVRDDVEADPVERQGEYDGPGRWATSRRAWLTAFVSLSIRKTRAACALQTSLDQKEVVAVLGHPAPRRRAVLGRRRSSGHASAPAFSRSTLRRAGRSRRREAGRRTRANNRRSPLAPTSTTNPDRPRTPFGQRSARVSSGCRVPRCPCSRRHGTLPERNASPNHRDVGSHSARRSRGSAPRRPSRRRRPARRGRRTPLLRLESPESTWSRPGQLAAAWTRTRDPPRGRISSRP